MVAIIDVVLALGVAVLMFFGLRVFRALATSTVEVATGASAAARLAREGFAAIVGWLSHVGPIRLREASLHLIVLAAAFAAFWADYVVLRDTIRVVWPDELSPRPMALGIVTLSAALGFLLHRVEGLGPRAALLLVLVGLVSVQGILAAARAVEMEDRKSIAKAAAPNGEIDGSLAMGNDVVQADGRDGGQTLIRACSHYPESLDDQGEA